jgi:hypothetical protein
MVPNPGSSSELNGDIILDLNLSESDLSTRISNKIKFLRGYLVDISFDGPEFMAKHSDFLTQRIVGRRAETLDALVYAIAAREGLALNLDMREAALKLEPQSAAPPRVTRSRWMEGI